MKKKTALLVHPWITDFAAYDFWVKPLALLRIGAVLQNSGFGVVLVDCLDRFHASIRDAGLKSMPDGTGGFLKETIMKPDRYSFVPRRYGRYGISPEALDNELGKLESSPDLVLVTSSMTYWYPGVAATIERVKARFPGAPIVLGGIYATLCPGHAVTNSGADIIFEGALDERFGRTVFDLTGVRIDVPGSFREFPVPAHFLTSGTTTFAVSFSRGCPFRCTYCASPHLHPVHERRTPEQAISEIEYLVKRCGAGHIAFYDDALLVDAGSLIEPLLRSVPDKGWELKFHTPNAVHASLMTGHIADLMFKSGFDRVMLGFESIDDDFHRETGGKLRLEQFERAVAYLTEAGFQPSRMGAYIIFGHPVQTAESIRNAMHHAAAAGIEPVPAEYSPVPGSPDFDIAVRTFRESPALDPLLHNSSIIQFQHPEITPEEFKELKIECNALRRKVKESGAKQNSKIMNAL